MVKSAVVAEQDGSCGSVVWMRKRMSAYSMEMH